MRGNIEGLHPPFRGFRADAGQMTVATSHKTDKENAMTEDEPDAIYYFRKAAEELEDQMTGPVYYLARGLLRLAENWGALTAKESVKVTVDLPSGH